MTSGPLIYYVIILIGTGATCIYPLLGATCNGWTFLATEILPSSVECARENVQRNKLDEKVKGLK